MTVCQFCGTKLMDCAQFCHGCGKGQDPNDAPEAGSQLADSVISHSTISQIGTVRIGDEKRYCLSCGTPVTDKNRSIKCRACGAFFCAACEADFRDERKRGERPLCDKCYAARQKKITDQRAHREAEERKKKSGKEIIENSIGTRLKLIPAGEFVMGDKKRSDARPHRVRITNPFYLGIYQVTQREWQAVMGGNPSNLKGDDHPVENVSWDDCQEFIAALNQREGTWQYRLPTEAEWEYACRAGSTTRYCFGNSAAQLGRYAWFSKNSGKETHQVGTKAPNAWGLHDMHGNVWEWCEDWYGDYPKGAVADSQGPSDGSNRVNRGGSWLNGAESCASAYRDYNTPSYRYDPLGLRLARSV